MTTRAANGHAEQWWFQKFAEETRALKMRCRVATIRSWQQPPDPLTTTWEVAQELNIHHSTVIWHVKQTGKVKELDKWVSCELTTNQKKSSLSVIFSYRVQQQGTISPSVYDVWRKVDFIQQSVMTSSMVGPRRNSKVLPKAELAPKEGSWSLFGGLLPVWSTTAFWIPVKPLHLRSMLSTSMGGTENCNTFTSIGQQKGPNSWQCPAAHRTTSTSKVEWIGLRSFASFAICTSSQANWLLLLQASQQLFAGKMLLQPVGHIKYFPRGHWILKHGLFLLQE